jgi:hypothetical protein
MVVMKEAIVTTRETDGRSIGRRGCVENCELWQSANEAKVVFGMPVLLGLGVNKPVANGVAPKSSGELQRAGRGFAGKERKLDNVQMYSDVLSSLTGSR